MDIWTWDAEGLQRLSAFLESKGITSGSVTAKAIGDGHSNLTYLISDQTGKQVVLRRPPPPPTPPGAHDMLREAKFISAIGDTDVPVAQCLATAEVGEVIDVHFYVMSYAPGFVVTDKTPEALADPSICRRVALNLIDTLADLHLVDWKAKGLGELGKPDGFNTRHLRSVSRLVNDENGNPPAHFRAVTQWLTEHAPAESAATVIHNDYRIGNVILSASKPGEIEAVLDWELATLGDPLFDLGYFLGSIPVKGSPMTPTQEMGAAMLDEGFPDREELAARYVERTGADLSYLNWYETLAHWKVAALYEYGRRRAERGIGDPYFKGTDKVASFLRAAHESAGLPALSDELIAEGSA